VAIFQSYLKLTKIAVLPTLTHRLMQGWTEQYFKDQIDQENVFVAIQIMSEMFKESF